MGVRVENQDGTKVQALSGGYAAHDERLGLVEDRLGDVAQDVSFLVARGAK